MLILKISGSQHLDSIKEDFNKGFSFLKLEFFKSSHSSNEPSAKKELIKGNPLLSTLMNSHVEGYVDIDPTMTVAQFEQLLHSKFGLNVQVFRKSGMVWLETSATDNMTLKGQNELGMEKSKPVEKTDITDIDYD